MRFSIQSPIFGHSILRTHSNLRHNYDSKRHPALDRVEHRCREDSVQGQWRAGFQEDLGDRYVNDGQSTCDDSGHDEVDDSGADSDDMVGLFERVR